MKEFIGIPFEAHGREFTGCDCWGLVYLWYRERLSIELPQLKQYRTEKDAKAISGIINRQKEHWRSVAEFETGDVIVFKMAGKECHVGIYLPGRKILHACAGIDSCVESLDHSRWVNRIAGGYRYE